MLLALKVMCIVIYAGALAGIAGWLPASAAGRLQTISAVILMVHALELVVMFRHVRLYRGPLSISVLLTLLFGMLHWKPLADQRTRVLAGQNPGDVRLRK